MLESPEPAQIKKDRYGNDLALGHPRGAFGGIAQKGLVDYLVIFLAKFIDNTKLIRNFIVTEHR